MLTPLDIQNKNFSKGMRGYKIAEVESFLDEVISDYEKLYKENTELKEKLTTINDKISHYSNIEDTLQNTLVVAQKTAEEVNVNAKNKSEQIINEAEHKAKKIIDDANNKVIKIQEEYEEIKNDLKLFKMRYQTLLKSQLEASEEFDISKINNDK